MKAVLALLIAMLASTSALGQDRPTIAAQPNTVFVGADGKFEANPDTALMQFNISAQEATSREAYDHASKSAEQVRQILRSNGIEPKSAEIGYFSLQPVYDYKTAKRKLVGYRVNANVSLKLKDGPTRKSPPKMTVGHSHPERIFRQSVEFFLVRAGLGSLLSRFDPS